MRNPWPAIRGWPHSPDRAALGLACGDRLVPRAVPDADSFPIAHTKSNGPEWGRYFLMVEAAATTLPCESLGSAKRRKCPHRYPQIISAEFFGWIQSGFISLPAFGIDNLRGVGSPHAVIRNLGTEGL